MSRKKGTPKTGGRRAGTPNKTTRTAREWIAGLIDKNKRQIEKDLKELDPKDRLIILEKLMAYTVPKMTTSQISIDKLDESALDQIIGEISQNLESE